VGGGDVHLFLLWDGTTEPNATECRKTSFIELVATPARTLDPFLDESKCSSTRGRAPPLFEPTAEEASIELCRTHPDLQDLCPQRPPIELTPVQIPALGALPQLVEVVESAVLQQPAIDGLRRRDF
jgi:hypothetical protein